MTIKGVSLMSTEKATLTYHTVEMNARSHFDKLDSTEQRVLPSGQPEVDGTVDWAR